MKRFLFRIVLLLIVYFFCRLLFFLFNHTHFQGTGISEFLLLSFYGIRFDASTIVMLNAPVFLFDLLPFTFRFKKSIRKTSLIIFCSINSIGILTNCVDIAYFPFILKRSTFDVFTYFQQGNDVYAQLPQYIADFWYIGFLWILLTAALIYFTVRVEKKILSSVQKPAFTSSWFFRHTAILAASVLFMIFLYRGGIQLKPVSIISAGTYTHVKNIPLVINTPFSILKTIDLEQITEKNHFSEAELKKHFNPAGTINGGTPRNLNVVLIILESFSNEYIGCLNGDSVSYTPFFDSLATRGLLFTNAYANGKKSIEALPAIVAGIPTLMNEPYSTSIYGSNRIQSLPMLLKEKGYSTSFFHGGTNGTMGFDAFAKLSGFEKYHGRNEYNNEKDFDGNWGIWDEEFYGYFTREIREMKQPFFTAFFSLSSHHPFRVPEKYKTKFPEGKTPISKSIRYADYALSRFMKNIAALPCFQNTVFVFTADHTGTASSPFYDGPLGAFRVPVLMYSPGNIAPARVSTLISHCDLAPTLLGLLGYTGNYYGFGKNTLDSTQLHFNVNYYNSTYQYIENEFLMHFNGENSVGLYNIKTDSLLQKNLINTPENIEIEQKMEKTLKSMIQSYNYSLIHNKMLP